MKKTIFYFVSILFMVLIFSFNAFADDYNPSREELETKIENVAMKRGIPSILLKAIARVETVFKHYDENGNVNRGSAGSIGLMQILNKYHTFDSEKLMYDIDYNIEAAAEIFLSKWDMSVEQKIPSIGNMDPNILENWYFALWAYNSWVESNNPNMMPYYFRSWVKKDTYQELIYMVSEKEYGQKINEIDFSYLPTNGLPDKTLNIDTPANVNYGNIVQYSSGDIVEVDSLSTLNLREEPLGEVIGKLENDQVFVIQDGPILKNGYYWYELASEDSILLGWAARNWLVRIGDVSNGRYPFNDIAYHWSRDYVMKLYNQGYVHGDSEVTFSPNRLVKKEELSAFISKALNLNETEELLFSDKGDISDWAIEYVSKACYKGLLDNDEVNSFNPQDSVTRKEAAVIISRIFEDNISNDEIIEDEKDKPSNTEETEKAEEINETQVEEKTEITETEETNIDETTELLEETDIVKIQDENIISENEEQVLESMETKLSFEDIDELSEEEKNAIKIVFDNSIMNGKSKTFFHPNDYLARSEIAAIMLRLINYVENV